MPTAIKKEIVFKKLFWGIGSLLSSYVTLSLQTQEIACISLSLITLQDVNKRVKASISIFK